MMVGRARKRMVGWLAALAGAGLVVAACSDDGRSPADPLSSAGEAGEAETSGQGGGAAGRAGAGGQAPAIAGAESGGVEQAGQGLVGGESAGGSGVNPLGGENAGGTSSDAGAGGSSSFPDGPYIACPAVGSPFKLTFDGYDGSEAEDQLLAAYACEHDLTLRSLTVERFQIDEPTIEVLASSHSLVDYYDWFTVMPDCGTKGYVTPPLVASSGPNDVTFYPDVFAALLQPGTYTRVSCEINMEEIRDSVPPAPTNIDCAHAIPLGKGLGGAVEEQRVFDDLPRFYSLTLSDPYDAAATWTLSIGTDYRLEGAAGALVTLHDLTHGTQHGGIINWLDGEQAAEFHGAPAADYCVEVAVDKGVKYAPFYTAYFE